MPRFHGAFRILGLVAALLWVELPTPQAASLPSTGLMGTVKSSEGKPMEGVAVSARHRDKTFTTSVYTNRDGEYFFPPLADGQYWVWAQAVGFEAARSEPSVSSGKKILQDFTLKPLQDFHKQLSSTEWTDSLPDDTAQDARMKRFIHYNCGSCHIQGFILSKRFDASGWGIIINTMVEHFTPPDGPIRRLIQSYREDLVEYLVRIRGPKPYPWKFKLHPRATGEATQIVVTEYDLPLEGRLLSHNGSDWSEGTISRYMGEALHDAVVGKDGNVYFSDNETPERTIGKLDPTTGRVTNYRLADKNNITVRTHGAVVDHKGTIWFTNGTEGTMLAFDPKTERFQRFPKPSSQSAGVGNTIAVDSKGNIWTSHPGGALRLNPETGEYTEFKSVTPGGNPYGITIDAEDNAWIAQLGIDKLMVVNGRTGEVSEVVLTPLSEEISEKDRQLSQRIGAGDARGAPLDHKGPRRLGADRKGDAVWVAEIYAGRLAKIDIHTKKVTEYPLPNKYSQTYTAIVDRNHMVWVPLLSSDYVAKFNPFTEQFTEYPLPTLRTENRFIDVDDSTDPPTVWLPYSQTAKIARVQFRTDPAAQGRQAVSRR